MADSITDNRGPQLAAAAITLYVLAFVALSLRFYVRMTIMKSVGLDDWFMLVAMVFYSLNTATCLLGVHYGTGQHAANLTPNNLSMALQFWWYCYLSYALDMISSKTSIAVFLLRITRSKVHSWIIYTTLSLTIFSGIAFFFVALLQCHPVDYFWKRTGEGSCINIDVIIAITCAYSSLAIITDFTFTILPVYLVWTLQMDVKSKIALIPILCMACIASCAVIVRLAYINKFRTNDFLYDTTDIAIWSQTEQGLAIAAGSLATLRPLFRQILQALGFRGTIADYDGRQATPDAKNTGKDSGYSGSSGRRSKSAPRSLFSLSTFTRMDDEEAQEGYTTNATHYRNNSRNEETEYRVAVSARKYSKQWTPPPQLGESESEEGLRVKVTKETTIS